MCSLNQSIAHFPKCVGSEQLSVRPLGVFKRRGSVDGELLVYVKDAFLAACSRVHYKEKATLFYFFVVHTQATYSY